MKREYDSCFKKCTRKKIDTATQEQRRKNFLELSDHIRLNITDIRDLSKELNKFFNRHYKIDIDFKVETREISNVSVSHNAPIGEKTNWHGDKSIPESFLGWRGNMSGKVNSQIIKKLKHPLTGRYLNYTSEIFDRHGMSFVRGINIYVVS